MCRKKVLKINPFIGWRLFKKTPKVVMYSILTREWEKDTLLKMREKKNN